MRAFACRTTSNARARELGRGDDAERIGVVMAAHGYADQQEVVVTTLEALDARDLLLYAGLCPEEIGAVRRRLIAPSA